MGKNVGIIDRAFRFLIGIILLTWAIAGGPYWTWLGIVPLATSAWAFCPLYRMIHITTRKSNGDDDG